MYFIPSSTKVLNDILYDAVNPIVLENSKAYECSSQRRYSD